MTADPARGKASVEEQAAIASRRLGKLADGALWLGLGLLFGR